MRTRRNFAYLPWVEPTCLAGMLTVPEPDLATDISEVAAAFRLRRRGFEAIIITGDNTPAPDRALPRALADAHGRMASLRRGIWQGISHQNRSA